MSDLSRLLDDVYGSATVTSLASTVTRAPVATPAPPIALPDPAPLPPAAPDPAALLEEFFDLGPEPVEAEPEPEPELETAPAARWRPADDDILPGRGVRRLGLRLRRG